MVQAQNKTLKEKAILLRKQGLSLKDIVGELKKPISTISLWVRHVELTPEQKSYLDSRNPVKNYNLYKNTAAIERTKITWMERRKKYQEMGREICQEAYKNKDIDFFVGIVLYWTEGYRSRNRNVVHFSNTDLVMVKVFVKFIKKFFDVEDNEICVTLHCWLGNNVTLKDVEDYWIKNLELNKINLRKTYVEQKRKVTGKRKNIHTYGVCRISLYRVDIIQKIYGAIQEYTGIDKPEWI